MKKWAVILIVVAVLAIAGLSLTNLGSKGGGGPIAIVPSTAKAVTAEGSLVPVTQSKLSFTIGGRVEEIAVRVGDTVAEGQFLARLDTQDLDFQVRAAQDALELSLANLAQMEAGPRQEDVLLAEANLRMAEARLAELRAGPTTSQVASAQAALNKAKNDLYYQQLVRDARNGNPPPYWGSDMGEALVGIAYEDVKFAEAQLAGVVADPRPETVAQAEAAVEAASQQLVRAREPFTEKALKVASTRVQQARTALEQAKAAQSKAILVAPYAGTVAELRIEVGDVVQPGVPVILFADLSRLEVRTKDLAEDDATKVSLGQQATVTMNAFENKVLRGKVTAIAPIATITSGGDANFTVTITLDKQDPDLLWGMTSKVEFPTSR